MKQARIALATLALAASVPAGGEVTRLAVVADGEHGPFAGTATAAPLVLSDEGAAIYFGAGECSPLAFMAQGAPRLLVGESTGRVVLVAPPLDPSLFDGWMLR